MRFFTIFAPTENSNIFISIKYKIKLINFQIMTKFLLKKLAVILLIALTTSVFAQSQLLTVGYNNNVKNQPVLTLQNDNQTTIRFELNTIELFEVNTDYGQAFVATSDVAPFMLQEGKPEMFYLTASFIIPDTGSSELEISCGQYQEFENIEIAPSKGNLTRNIDPATVPFVKGEIYQKDGFYPGTLASLREPFIMRDVRGQSVDVYPVQYNPVTKVLRVYSEIIVSVKNTRNSGVNEFINQKRHETIEPEFNAMYNRMFINSSVLQQRGYPTGEAGEILVICHTPWVNEMQPYIDWKRTMGRKTTLVSTATAGTTAAAIKTYITNFYNNPANNLAFVLLVGDAAQIPSQMFTGGSPSPAPGDILFGEMTGDNYLEILVGRMSAESVAHVQTQVQRTIHYERDLTTADTWIQNAMGVAANEGSGSGHDGGEADYVHMNNIRNRLLSYGYTTVHQDYTSGCGVPATSVTQISQHVNDGISMANYCNHGSVTAWTLTGGVTYSTTHVNQLQNVGKLPFICSVACNNGEFTNSQVCFAEGWARASYNGQPTGAVASLMGSISMSWLPPMTGQDEFVNIIMDLPSPYGNTAPIMRTIAGTMLNASQKMFMVHGSGGLNDLKCWNVFGDPSLNFRTKTPQAMTVSNQSTIFIGATSLAVTCNAEGAVAALSYIDNGEVIIAGVATVTGGVANIQFAAPLANPMDMTLCVTGFNKVAHLSDVSVIPPSGPYIVPMGYSVIGADVLTYYADNDEIEVTLKNVGVAPTSGTLTVTITNTDPQLTINTGTAQYTAVISPDGLATVKFKVTVANDIVDGKTFPVDLTVTQPGTNPWESKLILKAYAPKFSLKKVLINDVEGAKLPKGNLVKITTVIENSGGADAFDIEGKLEINDPYVIIACDDGKKRNGGNLPAGETMNLDFYVIVSPNIPSGYDVNMDFSLTAKYGRSFNTTFKATSTAPVLGNACSSGNQNCGENDKFLYVQILKGTTVLINNQSSDCASNGYQDYTHMVLPLEAGQQYTIKVKCGYSSQQIGGWFDLNGNNTFDANEKLITMAGGTSETTSTFTIPAGTYEYGNYRFRLVCKYNSAPAACSNSSYGQTHDYTISFPNTLPTVQNVHAELQGETAIVVTWQAPASGTPIGYNIYRNGNKLNGATPLTVLTYTENNITEGIYVYNVTAVYTGDKESLAEMSNVICNFTPPILCEEPVDLEGTAQKTTAILNWKKPANIDGKLVKYNIYRDEVKIGEASASVLTYQDKDLDYKTYVYKVSASYQHCSESILTDGVPVTIVCEMAIPTNLSGKDEEKTAVIIWSAPENPEGTLKGYNIYRDGTQINTAVITAMEYHDEDLENGTYIYKVSAVYEECESPLTEGVTVVINVTGICTIPADTFQIFPNPAHNELNITGKVVPTAVRLYNITGQMVYETTQCTTNMKISVTTIPAGVYFIKIDTEYGNVTRKIVVE